MKLTVDKKLRYSVAELLFAFGLIEKGILDPEGTKIYESRTLSAIRESVSKVEAGLLKEIDKIIDLIDPLSSTSVQQGTAAIMEMLELYSVKVSSLSSGVLYSHTEDAYKTSKRALATLFDADYSFIHQDELAVARVNKFLNSFIENHYKDDVTASTYKAISDVVNKSDVMSRSEISRVLKEQMPKLVKQESYFNIVVAQAINSSRSYSSMRFYEDAEIYKFRVLSVLDESTSEICKFMNGKILEVRETIKAFEKYDEVQDAEESKTVIPWIKDQKGSLSVNGKEITRDMTGEDLQALGVQSCPYHANCRTTVVPVF